MSEKNIYLVCMTDGTVIDIVQESSPEEAYDGTVANNYGELIVEIDSETEEQLRELLCHKAAKKTTLLNIVLFPDRSIPENDIPFGRENCIYLNGKYISRWSEDEYDDYTITWEAYCDIIYGIKMALPELTYRDILLDEAKLAEMFGEKWKEYEENGSLWIRIERYMGLQVLADTVQGV